jgi:diguanylate cyclase (GGDEF)-like protein
MLLDLLLRSNEEAEKDYSFLQKEKNSVIAETGIPKLQGKQALIWAKASRLYDQDGNLLGAIESIRDITKNKRMDEHLTQINFRDSLTNLYNRAYFLEELNRIQNNKYTPVALFIIAVNGLRSVNETLGYDAGDVLLLAAGNALKNCFNEQDILARVGGNEFAVLITNTSRSELERLRRCIVEKTEAYNEDEPKLLLSISIASTFRGSATKNMLQLFQETENSMLAEKNKKNRFNMGE